MRQYNIDLSMAVHTMSYRRFYVLLSHLHPEQSVTALLIQQDMKESEEKAEEEREITPDELMRFF